MTISRRVLFVLLAGLCAAEAVVAQEKSVKPGINKGYEKPDIEKIVKRFENPERDVVKKQPEIVAACKLKKGMVVADVGAGTGLYTRVFAKKVLPKGKVIAVDITPEFIKHVLKTCEEQKIKNVSGVLCKPASTELPKESVDVVFTCDTYHHFEFPFKMIASIRESLREGGHWVIVDRKEANGHVRADQKAVIKEVTSAGFELVDQSLPTDRHYQMRFKKTTAVKGGS